MFARILCPIDPERDPMDALELSRELAKQNSATVCLLTVIAEPLAPAAELPPVTVDPIPTFQAKCRVRLEALAREKLAEVSHEIFLATGNAAPQIVRLATEQHIDLIVMFTHGYPGIRHVLLGSVAERVVHESPVPVLTIRPHKLLGK